MVFFQHATQTVYLCVSFEIRNKHSPCHLPTYFKKILYFLLCTMKLKNLMQWKTKTKNTQCQKVFFLRWQIWLYPNYFLKENSQKWLLLSFWSYTKVLIKMEPCNLTFQLLGESFTNKTCIVGWKTFWMRLESPIGTCQHAGFKIQD